MSKFQRSKDLFFCTIKVISENRKLLLFPVVIAFFTIIISLFFLAPVVLANTGHSLGEAAHWKAVAATWGTMDDVGGRSEFHPTPKGFVLLAAIYLLSMFCATFFNTAFYHEIFSALKGEPVSIRGGLRFSATRIKAILAWTLFAGLIGLIIQQLESRVGLIGRWIVKLIGLAWSVASVFAIPVIVCEEEGANPVKCLRSSASLLRKTWGESLIGYAGISFGGWIVTIFAFGILILAGVASAMLDSVWPFAIGIVLFGGTIFTYGYVAGVASMVYRGALYLYASEGTVPGQFKEEHMQLAWKMKKG